MLSAFHFAFCCRPDHEASESWRWVTTVVRVLEAAGRENGKLRVQEDATNIFIYPPYRFHAVDVLLTNFHLPRSTLLMLVVVCWPRVLLALTRGNSRTLRFYSYGDCMLIL